ncbi:hypothetical protein [Nocardia africana]|uniref:Uncharacterized protein n=1 Tax=Nocardia africana TaxID=134964 RepID=A0ABW6NU70_9NOCA
MAGSHPQRGYWHAIAATSAKASNDIKSIAFTNAADLNTIRSDSELNQRGAFCRYGSNGHLAGGLADGLEVKGVAL